MQAKMKKRRDHHRHHWKLKGTHAPLIYGGELHGDSTDSRFVCLSGLFVFCLFVVHTFVWMRFVRLLSCFVFSAFIVFVCLQ